MMKLLWIALLALTSFAFGADPSSLFRNSNFTGVARARTGPREAGVIWSKEFGYQNVKYKVPMPRDARFPVASNTKLYVAVSLYQLQEQGKVNLSHAVNDYLTEHDFALMGVGHVKKYCPVVEGDQSGTCQRPTFKQLLGMSAGLPDIGKQFLPFPGSIALVVGWHILAPLQFAPGTRYYYSNPSFMLGAYFVEKFSGLTFEQYLQQHILDVIGMKNTYFHAWNGKFGFDPLRVDEFYSYINKENRSEELAIGQCSSEFDLGSANGAGGIISSPADEALLYYTLFNFSADEKQGWGKPLLQDWRNLEELVRPRTFCNQPTTPAGNEQFYAQGVFVWVPRNTTASNEGINLPQQIVYEGQIMCSWTANVFDMKNRLSPRMTQAYTNVIVNYITKEELNYARTVAVNKGQSYYSVTANYTKQTPLVSLAWSLLEML